VDDEDKSPIVNPQILKFLSSRWQQSQLAFSVDILIFGEELEIKRRGEEKTAATFKLLLLLHYFFYYF
jgi:hypothetical protein